MTLWKRLAVALLGLLGLLGLGAPALAQGPDPLPSWNAGPSRDAIVSFVERVTTPGSPDFVPPPDFLKRTVHHFTDPAVGMVTMGHYAADYDTPANRAFVKAWKDAYGAASTPDFMAAAGWDGMAAIVHVVRALDGKIDADRAMKALEGWKFDSPRGPIMIDPKTRDIVHDAHVQKVVKKGNRLAVEVLDVIPQVKDPCKELKVGKCAQ